MSESIAELTVSVEDLGPTRKVVSVELPADQSWKAYEEVLDSYVRRIKLKGFRPGMAPRSHIRQMFDPEIRQAVIERLVPPALDEALDRNGIQAATTPSVEDVELKDGEGLRFKVKVETWPDFRLPDYKGIRVKAGTAAVTDEDVDKAVDELRRKSADYAPVEGRGVVAGDYVVVERQGRDVKTRRLLPAERTVVLAGRPGNEPGLDEHMAGLTPGREAVYRQAFPADHPVKKLAGREIEFRLKVVSVKEIVLPPADDEFAKRLGEFDSLAALKDKIREELRSAREIGARRDRTEDVIKAVVDGTAVDLPEGAVTEEAEAVFRETLASAGRISLDRQAAADLRARAEAQARENLKRRLVLRKIALAEGLRIEEDEIDREIGALAKANGWPPERARESFRDPDRRAALRSSLLARKTVDFLVGQAIIDA